MTLEESISLSSITHYTYLVLLTTFCPHIIGRNKQTATHLSLTAHSAQPTVVPVYCTGINFNNGRFTNKTFLNEVIADKNTISLYAVNAHFQNEIAGKRIRDLQE